MLVDLGLDPYMIDMVVLKGFGMPMGPFRSHRPHPPVPNPPAPTWLHACIHTLYSCSQCLVHLVAGLSRRLLKVCWLHSRAGSLGWCMLSGVHGFSTYHPTCVLVTLCCNREVVSLIEPILHTMHQGAFSPGCCLAGICVCVSIGCAILGLCHSWSVPLSICATPLLVESAFISSLLLGFGLLSSLCQAVCAPCLSMMCCAANTRCHAQPPGLLVICTCQCCVCMHTRLCYKWAPSTNQMHKVVD